MQSLHIKTPLFADIKSGFDFPQSKHSLFNSSLYISFIFRFLSVIEFGWAFLLL